MMNVLMSTIGSRTARPPPSRASTIRLRRRRGWAAEPRRRCMLITVIWSAPHPDAFPALLDQVVRDAGDLAAVGEDARVGVEPDVDRVVRHRGTHRVLQGGRVLGRGARHRE